MMENDKIQLARQLVTQLVEGDFATVEQSLDDGIRQQLPADRQKAILRAGILSTYPIQ